MRGMLASEEGHHLGEEGFNERDDSACDCQGAKKQEVGSKAQVDQVLGEEREQNEEAE